MEEPISVVNLSLYSVCKTCTNSCCYNSLVNVLPVERDLIVERTGRADNFRLNDEGVIQINNSVNDPCIFLNVIDHTCMINDIKPVECKIYPLMFTDDHHELVIGKNCPAEKLISKKFLNTAKQLVADIPRDVRARFYSIHKKAGYIM